MKEGLERFSNRLKALRIEKSVKQSEMGEYLGCTERNYQRIEYGEINVQATVLMALADYFDVTTDYLLGRAEEKKYDKSVSNHPGEVPGP